VAAKGVAATFVAAEDLARKSRFLTSFQAEQIQQLVDAFIIIPYSNPLQ